MPGFGVRFNGGEPVRRCKILFNGDLPLAILRFPLNVDVVGYQQEAGKDVIPPYVVPA